MDLLSFKSVHFSFDSRALSALHEIEFKLLKGETLVLLGPSGTGKSTLFSLITGERKPLKGEVKVAVAPHEIALFRSFLAEEKERTLRELLEVKLAHLAPEVAHTEIHSLIDLLGLQYKETRALRELSQGQLTRAMMAHALIQKPKLVLLDEPLAHLDPVLKRELVGEYQQLAKELELTSLWITHDPAEALEVGDRLAYLAHGKIGQLGTPGELLFAPKSLDIARFFGALNVFVAKKVGPNRAKTSFAEFEVAAELLAGLESTFVVGLRPYSVELSSEGEFGGTLKQQIYTPRGIEGVVSGIDKNPIRLSFSQITPSKKIRFNLKWSEALLFKL